MTSKTNEKDQIPEFLYDRFPSEINSYSLNSTEDSPYSSITPTYLDPHEASVGYVHSHGNELHKSKDKKRRTSAAKERADRWKQDRKPGSRTRHQVVEESPIKSTNKQKSNAHIRASNTSQDSPRHSSSIYREVSNKFTSLMNSTDTSGNSVLNSVSEVETDNRPNDFGDSGMNSSGTIGPGFTPTTLDPGIGKQARTNDLKESRRDSIKTESSVDTSLMSEGSNHRDSSSINMPNHWSLSLHSIPSASSSSDSFSDEEAPFSSSPPNGNLHSSKTLTRGAKASSEHDYEDSVVLDTPENCTIDVVVKWLRLHKFNETWVRTFSENYLEKNRFYDLQSYENLRIYLKFLDTSDPFSTPARFLQLLRKEITHQIVYRPPPSITVVTTGGDATSSISMASSIVQSPTSMLSSDSRMSNYTGSSTESGRSHIVGAHNETITSVAQLGMKEGPSAGNEQRRKSDSSANSSCNDKYKLSPKSPASAKSKFSSYVTNSEAGSSSSSKSPVTALISEDLGGKLAPITSAPIPQLRKPRDGENTVANRIKRQSIPKPAVRSRNDQFKLERHSATNNTLSHSPSLVRRFTLRHKRSSSATTSLFSNTDTNINVNTDLMNIRSGSGDSKSPSSSQGPLHSRSKSKGSVSDASTPKGLFNKFFGKNKASTSLGTSEESPVSPISLASMFSSSDYKKSRKTSFEGERKRLSMFLGDYTFNEKKKKSTEDFLSSRRNTTQRKKAVPTFEKIGPVGKKPSPAGVTIPVITTSKLHSNQNHVSLSATNIRKANEIAASTRKLVQSSKSEAPYFFVDDKFRPTRKTEESKLYVLITADNITFKAVAVDSIKTVDEMKDKFTSELGFTDGELSRFYLTDFGCKRGKALEEEELQKLLDSQFFGGVCKLYVQPLTKLKPMASKEGIGLLEIATTQQIPLKSKLERESEKATSPEDSKQELIRPEYIDEANEEIQLPNEIRLATDDHSSRRSVSEGAAYDISRNSSRKQSSALLKQELSFRGTSTKFPGTLATSYSDHLAKSAPLGKVSSTSMSQSKRKKRSPSITRARSIARTSGDYNRTENLEDGSMRSFRVIRSERKEVNFDQRRKTPFITPSVDMSSSRRLSMSGVTNLVALRRAPPPPPNGGQSSARNGSNMLNPPTKVNRKPPPAFPPETVELMERRSSLRKLVSLSRKSTIRRKNTIASVRNKFDPFAENEVNFADASELDSSSTSSGSSSDSDSDLFAKVPTKPSNNAISSDDKTDDELSDQKDDVSTVDSNATDNLESNDAKEVSFSSDTIRKSGRNESQPTYKDAGTMNNKSSRVNSTSTSNTSRSKTDSSDLSFTVSSSDSSLDIRPPAEVVYDNLELYFPNADLDKMIIDEVVSPPVSPIVEHPDVKSNLVKSRKRRQIRSKPNTLKVDRTVNKSKSEDNNGGKFHRMKSIRIVAQEAKREAVMRQTSARRSGNLLRRKSTKMWGQKVIEVTPGTSSEVYVNKLRDKKGNFKQFAWVKGELIGIGTFGKVFLAMNVTTGEMIAVKQTTISSKFLDNREMKGLVKSFKAEVETLKDLDHENIVQYLGFGMKDNTYSIFLEYVSGGSVGHLIRSYGRFPEDLIRYLTKQVLQGLTYIHSKGILHRDLKADNLLLENDGVCKISDFGISKKSKDIYSNQSAMTFQGTIFWMAPEIIDAKAHNGYSAKVDIWSLGCVVLEMYAGKRPWHDFAAAGAIFRLGKKSAPPIAEDTKKRISSCGMNFLNKCFEIDPEKRPTAVELLKDKFCQVSPDFRFEDTELAKKMRYDNAQERRRMQQLKSKTRG